MGTLTKHLRISLAIVFLLASGTTPGAQKLVVPGGFTNDKSLPIPVSIKGFPPEITAILTFDLKVAGCIIRPEDESQFRLNGKLNGSKIEGHLTDAAGKSLISKVYQGAKTRTLTHAFANDVILKATGTPGIASTRVAFKNRNRGKGEIFIMDYDGHGLVQATRDGSIVAAPSWGIGNRYLFYTLYALGNPDIFSHNLSNGKRIPIVRLAGSNLTPVPSPNGRKLAMVLSKSGSPNLYVADMNGKNLRRLTHIRDGVSSPTWSPDGQWICYTSREAGPARLFKIRASGGSSQRISTVGAGPATEPDWSPDGKTIAFTTQSRSGFTLCTVPAAGGKVEFLVAGEDPSWAGNSRTMMFVKRRADQTYLLSILDVPTKQVNDVPLRLGNASQPAWAR